MKVTTCPECENEVSCTPQESCWCFSLPAILPTKSDSKCLCKACLIRSIAKHVNLNPKDVSDTNRQKIAELGPVNHPIEDIDYSYEKINGRELQVLTPWYLLRRGYCCNNYCRNCPYPKQKI